MTLARRRIGQTKLIARLRGGVLFARDWLCSNTTSSLIPPVTTTPLHMMIQDEVQPLRFVPATVRTNTLIVGVPIEE
jgi:hypothetical protein